ncbi:MAG: hypothetical protein KGP29_01610 [Proteobacteria bacterium]|nr:hypothetical protein [Pseudomonadota bacterium]
MPNELEEKINNIVSEQKIIRDFLTSDLFTKEDGQPETPISFNNGEEREVRITRVKNPEKIATELDKIYDKFADLGFVVKKEKIESLAYFFAVEKPAGSEVNLDPLTVEQDQIEIALAFLEPRQIRSQQEFSEKNFIFFETVGSISLADLQKFSDEKIDIFCNEIQAGKFNSPEEIEDLSDYLKVLEEVVEDELDRDLEEEENLEVELVKEEKILDVGNRNTDNKISSDSSIKNATRSIKKPLDSAAAS